MKMIKDKKVYILIAILFLFTLVYFISVSRISTIFDNKYDLEASYKKRVEIFKEVAMYYGNNHLDEFSEDGILYIDIQTLIDNNLLASDNDGNIVNNATKEIINDNKIRLKYQDEKMSAELYN